MKTAREAFLAAFAAARTCNVDYAVEIIKMWEVEVRAEARANADCGHVHGVPRPMTKKKSRRP
jgi:hypothetical protein